MKHYIEVVTGVGDVFIICTEIDDALYIDSMLISATDGKTLYSKHMTSEILSELAVDSGLPENEFKSDTFKAVTKGDSEHFIVQIERSKDSNELQLLWKKTSSDMKFLLGCISLKEETEPTQKLMEMMRDLVRARHDLNGRCLFIQAENARFKDEKDSALKLLSESAEIKRNYETELMDKFCQILNEKKAKIRELNQLLDEVSNSAGPSNAGDPVYESANDTDTEKDIVETLRREGCSKSRSEIPNEIPQIENNDDLFVPKRKPRGKGRKPKDGSVTEPIEPVKVRRTRSSQRSTNDDSLIDKLS